MAHCNSVMGSFFFFVISFFVTLVTPAEAQMVPAVFVFGDSLVDVGNNNHIKSLTKANFPHNGIDFPGQKPTGRFTNGKNAADFLAEKLGLPTSPPYLSLVSASNKSNAFLGGVSFASGGAGIMDATNKLFVSLSIDQQIDYYATVYGELVQQLGSVGTQQLLSKAMFGVVIGSNDMLGYFGPKSTLRQKITPQQLVDLMLSTLRGQLTRIYNLGARKFVMIGVGAIGCCPSQRNQNKTQACNEEANYWSHTYNEGIKALLLGMKSKYTDINYSFFDTHAMLLNFIQDPVKYGFKEVKAACCGLGELNAKVPCLPVASYCSNRGDHIFWDLYHPTEAAYRIFVDNVFDGSQPYVYPINGRQLAIM
ncbi:GDSL esterase/lipase At5g55050 [Macadamia integrifolia]|uniref:GDSL esterase/lipase At5g55050 n=1 Tax=Macadamia integrifolia TaxID=60698 RepID=UPI001C4FE5CF|nr:GDSL esterase/lipase At5g55050 [Macadamia integrifolia]XP_042485219.1 GDSL esterase/lipase At5g55050 [Macadamia integrifolia]